MRKAVLSIIKPDLNGMTNYWDKMHDSQMLAGTINAQQDELKVFELKRVGGFSRLTRP